MKRLFLLLFVIPTVMPFFAQNNFSINGRVVDALMRNELPGATVELLSAKDSSVISSIVADMPCWEMKRGE